MTPHHSVARSQMFSARETSRTLCKGLTFVYQLKRVVVVFCGSRLPLKEARILQEVQEAGQHPKLWNLLSRNPWFPSVPNAPFLQRIPGCVSIQHLWAGRTPGSHGGAAARRRKKATWTAALFGVGLRETQRTQLILGFPFL